MRGQNEPRAPKIAGVLFSTMLALVILPIAAQGATTESTDGTDPLAQAQATGEPVPVTALTTTTTSVTANPTEP
jgi:hypothetical protein